MTTVDNGKLYAKYNRQIQRCCIKLPCLVCGNEVKKKPCELKQHFEIHHCQLKNTCCWCLNYSWPPNEKMKHVLHLLCCFNRLLFSVKETFNHQVEIQSEPSETTTVSEELNRFQNRLAAMSKTCYPYACPDNSCLERVQPSKMEKHFKNQHSPFDPTVSCVWCKGAFVWPCGQKNRHVKHLKKCFEKVRKKEYMTSYSRSSLQLPELPPQPSTSAEKIIFTSEDCLLWVRNRMGRKPVLVHFKDTYKPLFETINYTVFPQPPDSRGVIRFQKGVETARFYSDLYRQHHHLLDQVEEEENDSDSDEEGQETLCEMEGAIATWYHVMISAYALEKFVQAVKNFGEEKVFTLPFWCWCDGGRYEKDVFRHHRHMILVVRNGYDFIRKCWRKLSRIVHNKQYKKKKRVEEEETLQEPLPEGFYMGRLKTINTWKHLLNVMRYVSSPESKCRYDFKGDYTLKNDKKRKRSRHSKERRHFFIWSGWHPHEMLCLVSTAANGFEMLLDQENKFKLSKSLDPEYVFRWPAENGPWHIRVGNFVKKTSPIVLPVEKCWQPVRMTYGSPKGGTESYLYLLNGKKLVFEKNEALESLSEEEWQRVQEQGCDVAKNSFYDAMAHDLWKLNKGQQNALNFAEKFSKRAVERAEERWRETLESKLTQKDLEWQSKIDMLRKEIELLKKQSTPQSEERKPQKEIRRQHIKVTSFLRVY